MSRGGLLALSAVVLGASAGVVRAEPCPAIYRASEPELAAELELGTDGRFHYSLSYGALDETAAGRWRAEPAGVRLSSDPLTAPEFALAEDRALAQTVLRVELELPDGISPQYFVGVTRTADGVIGGHQFAPDGLEVAIDPGAQVVSLRIDLPLFDLSSPEFALAGAAGHALKIRFSPNDLGKVDFTDAELVERDGALQLERQGRALAFRRVGHCQG